MRIIVITWEASTLRSKISTSSTEKCVLFIVVWNKRVHNNLNEPPKNQSKLLFIQGWDSLMSTFDRKKEEKKQLFIQTSTTLRPTEGKLVKRHNIASG